MRYTIKEGEENHILLAYDSDNNKKGHAVIWVSRAADLYEKPRLNIYIDIVVYESDNVDKKELKDQMFNELMRRSIEIKEQNKELDVRVYHCCFSDNKENIEYYSSKEGFKHDEGMHIIRKEIIEESFDIREIEDVDFVKLDFVDEEEIMEFIEKQKKVFPNSAYSIEDLKKLRDENEFFSVTAKHEGEIIGNIIFIVKEDESNVKCGWVDDLFVTREFRKRGISKSLILRALRDLKTLGITESRLEVWSANNRALSVYNRVGFEFYKETEASIGMFL